MKDINRIEIRGNVGQEPRVRAIGEKKVASFSVAVNKRWKNNDGEWTEETTWFQVTAWQSGGIDFDGIKKGARLSVVGEMRYRKYTDDKGVDHDMWEILAEQVEAIAVAPREEKGRGGYAPHQPSYQGGEDW